MKQKDGKGIRNGAVADPDEWNDGEVNGDPDGKSAWNGHKGITLYILYHF